MSAHMDSRYDTQAAHRAWIRRHEHSCRDDACGWCEGVAEDRARERDAEGDSCGWMASRAEDREFGGAW